MISIRIFHALFGLTEPLTITVDPQLRTEMLFFGTLTDYKSCPPGFHTVTVIGSESHRVYLQKTLPFFSPDAFTLAIIYSFRGMDVLPIPDYPCFTLSSSFACIRTVNLTNDPFRYQLSLYGNRTLFSDVWFRQITSHRRLSPGKHGIFLSLPGDTTPLIPSTFEARSDVSYTAFVYGALSGDTLSLLVQKDTPGSDQLPFQ